MLKYTDDARIADGWGCSYEISCDGLSLREGLGTKEIEDPELLQTIESPKIEPVKSPVSTRKLSHSRRNTQPGHFATFSVRCVQCEQPIFVHYFERETGIACDACKHPNGPWPTLLSFDLLPDGSAGIKDIISFSDRFNPLPHFRKLWGDEYAVKIDELWSQAVIAFEKDSAPPENTDALLMCLQYAIVLAPHGLHEAESKIHQIFSWLSDALRAKQE